MPPDPRESGAPTRPTPADPLEQTLPGKQIAPAADRPPLAETHIPSPSAVRSVPPASAAPTHPDAVSRDADTLAGTPSTPASRRGAVVNVPGYEILSTVGKGATGAVYQARQSRLNRVVALKVLLSGAHADDEERARFRTEALTVAQLQHPNVIHVYDVGEHEGLPFLAVEYVGGGNLEKWLGGQRLGVESAVKLVYQVARGVGAAHKKGIIHRDLKPANILLTQDHQPKVADFGLARQFGDASGLTATGSLLGTPQYMSPEQAAGLTRRVGPPSDVYALGVILYECLTGRCPHAGDTLVETLDRIRFSVPPPVRELRDDVPPELAEVLDRCLAKAPEQRYATADELADELARLLRGWEANRRAPAQAGPGAGGVPGGVLVGLAALGLVLVAVLLGFSSGLFDRLFKSEEKPAPAKTEPTQSLPNNILP